MCLEDTDVLWEFYGGKSIRKAQNEETSHDGVHGSYYMMREPLNTSTLLLSPSYLYPVPPDRIF